MNHRILTFGIIILFLSFISTFPEIFYIFTDQEHFSCSFGGVRAGKEGEPGWWR